MKIEIELSEEIKLKLSEAVALWQAAMPVKNCPL